MADRTLTQFLLVLDRALPHIDDMTRQQIIAIYVVYIAIVVALTAGILYVLSRSAKQMRAEADAHERLVQSVERAHREQQARFSRGRGVA